MLDFLLTNPKTTHFLLLFLFAAECLHVNTLESSEVQNHKRFSGKDDDSLTEILDLAEAQNVTDLPEVSEATTEPEDVTTDDYSTTGTTEITTIFEDSTTHESPTTENATDLWENNTLTFSVETSTFTGPTIPQTSQSTDVSESTTSSQQTTSAVDPQSTTSSQQTTTSAADPETTQSTTSSTTSSSTSSPTTSPTTASTTILPVCTEPGFFGDNCTFRCNCWDPQESCDALSGICQSGCAPGFYGPGCLARESGDLSVIVFLSVLLVFILLICLAQCLYIMVYRPYRKMMKTSDEYAAANGAFDFTEEPQMNNHREVREPQGNVMPMTDMSRTVPRVKETNIQVTSDVLGRGRFGDVLKGTLKTDKGSIPIAFKNIGGEATEEEREAFMGHLEVNAVLKENDNVIRFYGVTLVGGEAFAAFEYAGKGNLRNFLRINEDTILHPRGKLLEFALDIAQGMSHLASKQIIHRELCCEHVLLTDNLTAKVSGIHAPNAAAKKSRWMAPEALLRGDHSTESDVWSYGVTLWEIMSLGDVPYAQIEVAKLASHLDAGSRLNRPDDCDSDIYSLMKWCWLPNMEDRPPFPHLANTITEMMEMNDSEQVRLDLEDSDIEEV